MDDFEKQKIQLEIQEKELEAKEFLNGFSAPKRTLFVLLIVLAIPAFFAAKYATAAMYLLSYQKRQPYAQSAQFTVLPVKVLEAKNLQIAGNNYSSYALVKNQNKDLSAPVLNYTFNLYDAAGKIIATYSDKSFLLPGEQKYLILPHLRLDEAPVKVDVQIQNPDWQKRLGLPNVVLQTGVPSFGDQASPDGFYIKGNVSNTSNYALKTVRIKAIIFNASHQVIAVTQTDADTIQAKELRAYKMFWPVPLAQFMAGSPQITAETNILDSSNLQ